MCEFYCIAFIEYMIVRNFYKKNDYKTTIKRMMKYYITTFKANMAKQNVSLVFRLQNIDEARNYSLKELNDNKLVSEKQKKV